MLLYRRQLVLMAFTLGAVHCVQNFGSTGILLAAETPAPTAERDPFRLPAIDDPRLLVAFVHQISQLAPGSNEDPAAHAQKQSQAIRAACQRIRTLQTDPKSDIGQFAGRKLAMLDVQDLSQAATPAQRDALATKIRSYLDSAPLTDEDLQLLVMFSRTAEYLQMEATARAVYDRFGAQLLQSKEPSRRELGQTMAGAARRLGCVGKPFVLAGQGVDGQKFDIAQLKGKVVLVTFWKGSNEFVRELLYFRYLARDFQSQGFEMVGVCGDDRASADSFLSQVPIPWPTLLDQSTGDQLPATQYYGVHNFPTTFLLDRDGKILDVGLRGRDLRRRVIQLLGPAATRPIVSDTPEATTSINDLENRVVDAGEQWIAAGTAIGGKQLLAAAPPAKTRGSWLPPQRQPLDDEELFKRALKSVFVVGTFYRTPEHPEWQASSATAFAVAADGVVCTSAHVVDFSGQEVGAMMAINSAGEVFPVERVLAVDVAGDTCLLQIRAKNLVALPLADRVPVGARVRIVGHPGFSAYYLSVGHVAGHEAGERGLVSTLISAEFGEGASGAPVFDQFGNVAAQVSSTRTIFAVPQGEADKQPGSSANQPQMVFRYCTPMSRLRELFIQ
ncbi:MAG: trypsin-like peptidase domain-containing protein [Planctomycetes bacterium]|nr:trypsin-like peptidase domain-containing protein [Planctomycetota bacterium]